MLSPEEINEVYKHLIGQMASTGQNKNDSSSGEQSNCRNTMSLTPAQILVIIGLLTGALQVDAILIDRDQTVIVYLEGDLKVNMAKAMDQAKSMSFEELLKSILSR